MKKQTGHQEELTDPYLNSRVSTPFLRWDFPAILEDYRIQNEFSETFEFDSPLDFINDLIRDSELRFSTSENGEEEHLMKKDHLTEQKTSGQKRGRKTIYCFEQGCSNLGCYFTYDRELSLKSEERFCCDHRKPGMVRSGGRRLPCGVDGCTTTPSFGYEESSPFFSQSRRLRCSKHREKDMVYLAKNNCLSPGCKIRPCFSLPGQTPKFCKEHKTEEMKYTNISPKRICTEEGCYKRFSYIFPDQAEEGKCYKHRTKGMIKDLTKSKHKTKQIKYTDFSPKKICTEEGCRKRFSYIFPDQAEEGKCYKHRTKGMIKSSTKPK